MKSMLVRASACALVLAALYGCGGGSDGAAGINGTNGVNGVNGTNGTNAVATINAAAMTADQWSALKPQATITSVAISGQPVVKFKVTDDKGTPIVGLGGQSKSSTAIVPTNYNIAFTLAKLVPGTNGAPSKWVSYLVTKPGTVSAPATAGTFPTTDSQGVMADNGDGTYQYTFWRDVTKVKDVVAGLTDTATNLKADLGDVTYDPSLTHRLGMIINGSQPGTGTATPNAVQAVPAVALVNTFNLAYDFVPAGGAVSATRDIVVKESCMECHSAPRAIGHISTTASPGNYVGRYDPRLCVTCHTDQTKYSFTEVTKTATGYSGGYMRINGESAFTYPRMIHQTHMGDRLTKTGYNLNNHCNTATGANLAQCFNLVGFPQEANCTKCHDGSATAKNKTANGDNWKNVPSRLACGACHDGIDWATGKGTAIGAPGQATGGHVGGAQSSDANCALCHDAASITVYHTTNVVTAHNPTTPAGVTNFTYAIKSVSLNASRQAQIVFQITQDGKPVTAFNAPTTVVNTSGATVVDPKFQPITGFVGGPSFYVAYAVPQDGITAPADFNVSSNVSLTNLLVSGSLNQGSLTGPDANGYWTATLKGTTASPIALPASAAMVTGALIGSFTQINLPAYPYTFANVTSTPNVSASGGLVRPSVLAKVAATGFTARRVIVDTNKCNNCHDQLGTNPSFHGGARNDATACNICHNGNRTSNGWSADSSTYIHGIHGASKRTVQYKWAATSATDGYYNVLFPGLLRNCEQCHVADTYNFGATAAAVPNLLWSTTATGKFDPASTSAYRNSPYIVADNKTDYGAGFSFAAATGTTTPAAGTTLVNSPISSACFSCHDTATAKAHMQANGGAVYEPRSTAMAKVEQCLVCHGAGKVADVKAVHNVGK